MTHASRLRIATISAAAGMAVLIAIPRPTAAAPAASTIPAASATGVPGDKQTLALVARRGVSHAGVATRTSGATPPPKGKPKGGKAKPRGKGKGKSRPKPKGGKAKPKNGKGPGRPPHEDEDEHDDEEDDD